MLYWIFLHFSDKWLTFSLLRYQLNYIHFIYIMVFNDGIFSLQTMFVTQIHKISRDKVREEMQMKPFRDCWKDGKKIDLVACEVVAVWSLSGLIWSALAEPIDKWQQMSNFLEIVSIIHTQTTTKQIRHGKLGMTFSI